MDGLSREDGRKPKTCHRAPLERCEGRDPFEIDASVISCLLPPLPGKQDQTLKNS